MTPLEKALAQRDQAYKTLQHQLQQTMDAALKAEAELIKAAEAVNGVPEGHREALLKLLRFGRDNSDRADAACKEAFAKVKIADIAYKALTETEPAPAAQTLNDAFKKLGEAKEWETLVCARAHEASRVFCAIAYTVGEALLPGSALAPVAIAEVLLAKKLEEK